MAGKRMNSAPGTRLSYSRSLRVTWIGLPLMPAPFPRAAARFAIAGLEDGGSGVVVGVGLARLASNSAAIFSLLDCGAEGGGADSGVVSGEEEVALGGRESRRDCRLRTAWSMEGSRPELASASRYIPKASSERRRGEAGLWRTVGETAGGEEETHAIKGVLPAVDEGEIAFLGAGRDQGVEEGEVLWEVVWGGVGLGLECGDVCSSVKGRGGVGPGEEGCAATEAGLEDGEVSARGEDEEPGREAAEMDGRGGPETESEHEREVEVT